MTGAVVCVDVDRASLCCFAKCVRARVDRFAGLLDRGCHPCLLRTGKSTLIACYPLARMSGRLACHQSGVGARLHAAADGAASRLGCSRRRRRVRQTLPQALAGKVEQVDLGDIGSGARHGELGGQEAEGVRTVQAEHAPVRSSPCRSRCT